MKTKHIGRALVCLLLVCCLLFNISPIRAHATGAAVAVGISVAATSVIAAALIACGVSQGESPTDFDYAVDACKQWLAESTEWLTDGGEAALAWVSGTVYASAQFVDDVRNWLFDSGVVSLSFGGCQSGTYTSFSGSTFSIYCETPYQLLGYYQSGGVNGYFAAQTYAVMPPEFYGHYIVAYGVKTYYYDCIKLTSGCYALKLSASTGVANPLEYTDYSWHYGTLTGLHDGYSFEDQVITSRDLVLNSLMSPSVSIATGYADWAAGAITVPGSVVGVDEEEETLVYPLGLGQTYEDTKGMTQADVWTGTGTYVDTKTEALTGTFADTAIGTFINSLIDALWTPVRWIGEQIAAIPAAFAGWFADVIAGIQSIPDVITSTWDAAVAAILAGIQAIFVPTEDFLTAKVEALRAEFAFADAVISSGESLKAAFLEIDTEAPVIFIDLAANRGPYDMGGRVVFLDLRWYSEYKPTVDLIIPAFLWICFIWRILVKIPGIISGMPGEFLLPGVQSLGMGTMLVPFRREDEETGLMVRRRDK